MFANRSQIFYLLFRIPASLTLTTTCSSPCASLCGSPARPTPLLSAASRKRCSPSSLRSFRTMSRVCQSPLKWTDLLISDQSRRVTFVLFLFCCRVSSVCVPGDVPPPGDPLQLNSSFLYGFVPSPAAACAMGKDREHPPSGSAASGLPGERRRRHCQHCCR